MDFETDDSGMIFAKFIFSEGNYDAKITEIIFDNSADFFDTGEFLADKSSDGVEFYSTDKPSAPQWNSFFEENFSKDVTDFYAFDIKEDKKSQYSTLSKGKKFKGLESGQYFSVGFKLNHGISEHYLKTKMKIGFHAQSISSKDHPDDINDFSDSFFRTCAPPSPTVPTPSAILLGTLGTVIVSTLKRHTKS